MPADVQKAKNFLLTTDFPLDKVIYLQSGSDTIPFPTAGYVVTIAHGLPFIPLVSGSWSLTSDFSLLYEYGSGTFPSSNIGASNFDQSMTISADSVNVYITPINVSGSSFTLYYRIFAFEPSDSNEDLEPTASAGDDFVLNTDYNYTKLYLNDVILSPAVGTEVILHNLGYEPQVMAWVNDAGITKPIDVSEAPTLGTYVTAVVTDTTLEFIIPVGLAPERIDYRLYLDDH